MINYSGYLDRFQMVSCNKIPLFPADDTENGLLFTSIAILSQLKYYNITQFNYENLFNNCFIDGRLYRHPDKHPKGESHDDYCGTVLGSLLENTNTPPRKLLWSMIKHLGYINGEWVGRFAQVWLLLWSASFKLAQYLLFPLLYVLFLLQNPQDLGKNNASDIQLQLTIVSILDIMFPGMKFFNKWKDKLPCSLYEIFSIYYGENHPTTLIWKENE